MDERGGPLGKVAPDPARIKLLHDTVECSPGGLVVAAEQREHFLEGAVDRGCRPDGLQVLGSRALDMPGDFSRWGAENMGGRTVVVRASMQEECDVSFVCAPKRLAEAPLRRGRQEMVEA